MSLGFIMNFYWALKMKFKTLKLNLGYKMKNDQWNIKFHMSLGFKMNFFFLLGFKMKYNLKGLLELKS